MTLRSAAQLAVDFPVDNFTLPATVKNVDNQIKRGELSGVEAVQALGAVGAQMSALAEAVSPPTGAYTGTAGAITQAYGLLAEYPLAQQPSPLAVSGNPAFNAVEKSVLAGYSNLTGVAADAIALAGQPLEGRGMTGIQRSKRYGDLSPVLLVTLTSALSASNFVTLTTPSFSSSYTAKPPTFAILKPSGSVLIGGTFHVNDVVTVSLGNGNLASVTVTSPMLNLAGVAAALNVAISQNPGTANVAGCAMNAATLYFFGGAGFALAATVTGTGATVTATPSGSTLTGGGALATGVVPGSTFKDVGTVLNSSPVLPPYPEFCVIPPTSATIAANVNTAAMSFSGGAGQKIGYQIGTTQGSYTTVTGDSTLAIALTSLAAAMQTTMRTGTGTGYTSGTVVASASGLVVTWGVTGPTGNDVEVGVYNATSGTQTLIPVVVPIIANGRYDALWGGAASVPLLGPTTAAGATGFGV